MVPLLVGELLRRLSSGLFGQSFGPDPHQQMEVVAHQAVGKGFRHGDDVFGIELHEESVLAVFEKDVGAVHPAIAEVVHFAGLERNYGLHDPSQLNHLSA